MVILRQSRESRQKRHATFAFLQLFCCFITKNKKANLIYNGGMFTIRLEKINSIAKYHFPGEYAPQIGAHQLIISAAHIHNKQPQ